VSAHLTLLDAPLVAADTGEDHEWLPGEDVAADIDAVLRMLPTCGHRRNTARENIRRPIAYLYARTALLGGDERKQVQSIARGCTGFVDSRNGINPHNELVQDERTGQYISVPQEGQIWIRLNGEASGWGREPKRDVGPGDRDAVWRLDFRTSDTATPRVKALREQIQPGLRALGCAPGKCIRLPNLAPLILAMRWTDAVRAAVFLAGSGIAPRSDAWAVLVDQAQDQPWHEELALLSARHPRDVLSRALAWVHASGMRRRAGR
jgi:hypothetical protein